MCLSACLSVSPLSIQKPKASSAAPEAQAKDDSRGGRWSRKPRCHRSTSVAIKPLSKKQLCRLYGVIQRLYQKNRSHCAKTVLSGDWAKEKTATHEEQKSYWKPLFEKPSKPDAHEVRLVSRTLFEISLPVAKDEYERVLKSTHNSSPGLDGVDRKVLSGIDARIGAAHMNLWLLAGRPHEPFKVVVTVPLPKAADATGPAEYRLITIGSMLCRLFHRLVAHRAERSLPLGPRQKAFQEGDGLTRM